MIPNNLDESMDSQYNMMNSDEAGTDDSSDNNNSDEASSSSITKTNQLQEHTVQKISKLVMEGMQSIERYNSYFDDTNIKNHHDDDNDTSTDNEDPSEVLFSEIHNISNSLIDSWKLYQNEMDKIHEDSLQMNDKMFRKLYMDIMTQSFADELDALRRGSGSGSDTTFQNNNNRNNGINHKSKDGLEENHGVLLVDDTMDSTKKSKNNFDVEVMIHILESGMDSWTDEEKHLLVSQMKHD